MSPEELNARDMAIEQQLNFLSKQSAPKEMANKPLKIKNEVTKDMIDDFKAEQQGSIFHPPSILPVLETFHPIDVADKGRIEARKEELLKIIQLIEGRIQGRIDAIPMIKDQYNTDMRRLQVDKLSSKSKQELKDIEAEKRSNTEQFERIMAQIDSEIAQLEREKQVNISKINALDKIKSNTDALIQENESEKARVERVNREAIKTFENEINALNKGININQQVGESDEDYLQRIENMKGARYGQDTETQATTFNVKRLKTKMKEIMTIPEEKLEKIIKLLDKNFLLYEANKKFPLLKSAIEKTYGLNPRFTKANDEYDLYKFIEDTLTNKSQEKEIIPETIVVASKNSDLIAKTKTGFISKNRLMEIYTRITGKKSFKGTIQELVNEIVRLRELEEANPTDTRSVKTYRSSLIGRPFALGEQPEQDLSGFTPQEQEAKRRGRPTKAQAEAKAEVKRRQEVGAVMEDILTQVEKRGRKPLEKILAVAESVESKASKAASPTQLVDTPPSERPKQKKQTKIGFAKKGSGVEREFYPKLVPFGAITISPAQLFYYKVLRVREPTKHSIRGMPDVRVSDDMVHILMKIINGGTPSMTELRALSEDEKTIYDAVIMKAKLHKEMPNSYEQSIQSSVNKLKKRLELCEGEWNAGNDNTKIKKELNSIIRQLTELKAITEQEGRKYLKQF